MFLAILATSCSQSLYSNCACITWIIFQSSSNRNMPTWYIITYSTIAVFGNSQFFTWIFNRINRIFSSWRYILIMNSCDVYIISWSFFYSFTIINLPRTSSSISSKFKYITLKPLLFSNSLTIIKTFITGIPKSNYHFHRILYSKSWPFATGIRQIKVKICIFPARAFFSRNICNIIHIKLTGDQIFILTFLNSALTLSSSSGSGSIQKLSFCYTIFKIFVSAIFGALFSCIICNHQFSSTIRTKYIWLFLYILKLIW